MACMRRAMLTNARWAASRSASSAWMASITPRTIARCAARKPGSRSWEGMVTRTTWSVGAPRRISLTASGSTSRANRQVSASCWSSRCCSRPSRSAWRRRSATITRPRRAASAAANATATVAVAPHQATGARAAGATERTAATEHTARTRGEISHMSAEAGRLGADEPEPTIEILETLGARKRQGARAGARRFPGRPGPRVISRGFPGQARQHSTAPRRAEVKTARCATWSVAARPVLRREVVIFADRPDEAIRKAS